MAHSLHCTSFVCAFNKALGHFENDELHDCAKECQEILNEQGCPPYFSIKTLVLYGSCVDNITDVAACYNKAKRMWQVARFHQSENSAADNEALDDLKVSMDSLRSVIDQEVTDSGKAPSSASSAAKNPDEVEHVGRQTERKDDVEEDLTELCETDSAVTEVEYQKEEPTALEGPTIAERAAANAANVARLLCDRKNELAFITSASKTADGFES